MQLASRVDAIAGSDPASGTANGRQGQDLISFQTELQATSRSVYRVPSSRLASLAQAAVLNTMQKPKQAWSEAGHSPSRGPHTSRRYRRWDDGIARLVSIAKRQWSLFGA